MNAFETPRTMLSVQSGLGVIGSGVKTIDSISSSTQSTASSTTDSENDLASTTAVQQHANGFSNGLSNGSNASIANALLSAANCTPASVAANATMAKTAAVAPSINNGNYSLNTSCHLCLDTLSTPKVLSCLHTFCQMCLERIVTSGSAGSTTSATTTSNGGSNGGSGLSSNGDLGSNSCYPAIDLDPGDPLHCTPHDPSTSHICCPICNATTYIPDGVSALATDYAVANVLENLAIEHCKNRKDSDLANCTGCKGTSRSGAVAVARCFDCSNLLCTHCAMAHQYMHCFEGHRVTQLTDMHKTGSSGTTGGSTTTTTTSSTSSSPTSSAANNNADKPVQCRYHRNQQLTFYCRCCDTPICKECKLLEHKCHDYEFLSSNTQSRLAELVDLHDRVKDKISKMSELTKVVESSSARIAMMYQKAEGDINDTYNFYRSMIDERKSDALKELDQVFGARQLILTNSSQKLASCVDSLLNGATFIDKLLQHASPVECLLFKRSLDSRLSNLLMRTPDDCQQAFGVFNNIEFISNFQAIQVGVKNTFGYIRPIANSNDLLATETQFNIQNEMLNNFCRQTPTAPTTDQLHNLLLQPNHNLDGAPSSFDHYRTSDPMSGDMATSESSSSIVTNNSAAAIAGHCSAPSSLSASSAKMSCNGGPPPGPGALVSSSSSSMNNGGGGNGPAPPGSISNGSAVGGRNNGAPYSSVSSLMNFNVYDRWSNTGSGSSSIASNPGTIDMYLNSAQSSTDSSMCAGNSPMDVFSQANAAANGGVGGGGGAGGGSTGSIDSVSDLTNKMINANIYPPKSQLRRLKMIYHCKFGEFGVMEGQFTEPSGVAVNGQNDIVVADTNNHRIQIFDKEGRFKFQFGECGKRDGQLLYPNRVAVVRSSGDIVVTERSPTHQVQIYNQYGQFVRKFGSSILQHPRGVTVDSRGRIIIIECKVMRVIIFDQMGSVLSKFSCSKHLEFPNGVVVNDRDEIFISDNRAHCVKVFSYTGIYLRQIGNEGVTNYPIGVGISYTTGDILIADNHNNFNLTTFSQDGRLQTALESKVKHAQCFDVALMDDGSIVLASKDYRLYIYRYALQMSNGVASQDSNVNPQNGHHGQYNAGM